MDWVELGFLQLLWGSWSIEIESYHVWEEVCMIKNEQGEIRIRTMNGKMVLSRTRAGVSLIQWRRAIVGQVFQTRQCNGFHRGGGVVGPLVDLDVIDQGAG